MNILITGYKGFIGRNLIDAFDKVTKNNNYFLYDKNNTENDLKEMCANCNIVFHLAAVVRPQNHSDYLLNTSLTAKLLSFLKEQANDCPVIFASSIQAVLDNPYAKCKREEEKMILDYGKQNKIKTYIFRFPNLFGKYSKPNYTSVISTFCYNSSHNLPIVVNDPSAIINFAYIDDVLATVFNIIFSNDKNPNYDIIQIKNYYPVGLGELAYYMQTLKSGLTPELYRNDNFYEKLKITYEWFLERSIS